MDFAQTAMICDFGDLGPECDIAGHVVTVPPEGDTLNPTCYNPMAVPNMTSASEEFAVRCFSPLTGIGISHPGCKLSNYSSAVLACEELVITGSDRTLVNDVTDWRLPENNLESGCTCGTGCGWDTFPSWVHYSNDQGSFTLSPLRTLTRVNLCAHDDTLASFVTQVLMTPCLT
eukprot:1185609-Prorocentrum_minimum.AAC.2